MPTENKNTVSDKQDKVVEKTAKATKKAQGEKDAKSPPTTSSPQDKKVAQSEKGKAAVDAGKGAKNTQRLSSPQVNAEVVRLRKEERSRASRRRTRQFIGFALMILIVVGAVSIVMGGVSMVQSLLDNSDEEEIYQTRFEPMVWFEMIPFENVAQVDENSIKQVCIWGVLDQQGDSIMHNERGEPLVSAASVERYAAELFGPDFRFSAHEDFADPIYDLRYTYDAETQMYTAPSTSLQPPYIANVVDVVGESGGVKRVIMGYVSTMTGDDQIIAAPDLEHPAFYMDYLLQRDGNEYYLYSIQRNTTYVPETTASSSETSVPPAQSIASVPAAGQTSGITSQPASESGGGVIAAPSGTTSDASEAASDTSGEATSDATSDTSGDTSDTSQASSSSEAA